MSASGAARPDRWRWLRGLRARFVLILLLAVILPNVLLAVWIGRYARASALAQLEQQLDESLATAARTVGNRWIETRASLLTLGEDPRVLAALQDSSPSTEVLTVGVDSTGLERAAVVGPLTVLDAAGRRRVEVNRSSSADEAAESPGLLPVSLPIYDLGGMRLGTLEARIPLTELLPPLYGWGAAAGAVPAVLTSDGTPLVPVSLEPLLRGERHFIWEGQEWLAVSREGNPNSNLDFLIRPIGLTGGEKQALIAFLRGLTGAL